MLRFSYYLIAATLPALLKFPSLPATPCTSLTKDNRFETQRKGGGEELLKVVEEKLLTADL